MDNIDEYDYMTPTDSNNKVFLASDTPFLNSDLLFVEYLDVLKSPLFLLLQTLKENPFLNTIFNLEEIRNMQLDELYKWYVNRKEFDIFHNFPVFDNAYNELFNGNVDDMDEWCNTIILKELETIPSLISDEFRLNFYQTLVTAALDKNIVKDIIIYTPWYSYAIEQEVEYNFPERVTYAGGDLLETLKDPSLNIGRNSTFVFSDASKIYTLEEANLLGYSSVIIADKYGYNYNEDGEFKYDLSEQVKTNLFKLNFFDNLTS